MNDLADERAQLRCLDEVSLRKLQLQKLNALLEDVLPRCPFYQHKFGTKRLQFETFEQLAELPLLEKHELISPTPGEPAAFHTLPRDRYIRFHRTSGTSGRPMPVFDTADDWRWWIETWQYVLDEAEVTPKDVAVMAFSFGPFIGFWSANDALVERGCLVVPAGGMSSAARLRLIMNSPATVLCCTPTYALRLAAVAESEKIEITASAVSRIIDKQNTPVSLNAVCASCANERAPRTTNHCSSNRALLLRNRSLALQRRTPLPFYQAPWRSAPPHLRPRNRCAPSPHRQRRCWTASHVLIQCRWSVRRAPHASTADHLTRPLIVSDQTSPGGGAP